ncbi:TatD family hydrolase [Candidatus Woesearchaeota archaeon]|nr:TatD family hydrolase [Candidatus Woesearchaeota archaeon]
MIYADIHAHLDLFPEVELAAVLERAERSGIKRIITCGIDLKSNRSALKIAEKHDLVKPALGIYPAAGVSLSDDEIESEISFIRSKDIIAVAEIGLDYHECLPETFPKQKEVLAKQLSLARQLDKPVVVHTRKAEADTVEMLINSGSKKVVLHCFMGKLELVKKAVDAGFHFSIPLIISRSSHFRKLAEAVPLNRLLTETDAPFLSPMPGTRSEPAMIQETIREIAKIKGLTEEDCANILYSNQQKLFL